MSESMSDQAEPEPDRSSPELSSRTDLASQPALQGYSGFQHQQVLQNQPGLQGLGTTQVRLRVGERCTETISDYLHFFEELQIDRMYHSTFWTEIIYRYRQATRHLPLLKRGTAASIKNMSDDVLRAYGERLWSEGSAWRRDLEEGEEMLLYHREGANTRLHEILAKIWWTMRELVFEAKPEPRSRRRGTQPASQPHLQVATRSLSQSSSRPGEIPAGGTISEGDETYQADIDDSTPFGSEFEAEAAMAPRKKGRAKGKAKAAKVADEESTPPATVFLTADEVDERIIEIVQLVENVRAISHPYNFERSFEAHACRAFETERPYEEHETARLERHLATEGDASSTVRTGGGADQHNYDTNMEIDTVAPAGNSGVTSTSAAATTPHSETAAPAPRGAVGIPYPLSLTTSDDIRQVIYPNLSSEPFNTSGNPIPPSMTEKRLLPPTIPERMSIYIMTSPPHSVYAKRAYAHPGAPVREQDQVAFFKQVMERAEKIADENVKGYALSYGWCDISRWIEKTVGHGCRGLGDGKAAGESEGERVGWEVFRKDLVDAAKNGVMIWRMKVLVVEKKLPASA